MGVPLRPPRLTGDQAADSAATVEYLWLWYRNIVEEQEYVRNVDANPDVINDPQLAALADLTPTAIDNLPYFTSETEAALTALAAFGRIFIAATTDAEGRTALNLGPGATAVFGTGPGDLAEGNDARFLTAAEKTDLTDGNDSAAHFHASDRARANHTGTQAATTVVLDRIGASTYSTVQDLQNIFHSAGWVTDCAVTDNGDGTVAVGSGTGVIRATDSAVANIKFFDIGNTASVSLTDLSFNWVYIDYNAGTPVITASTTEPTEHNTKIKLAAIYRNGTELHINQEVRYEIGDHAANMVRQMQEVMPYAHVSGAAISETGTRNLSVTDGVFWHGLSRFPTTGFDTAVSGSFSTFYLTGAAWTKTTGQTQIDNTQYNDTASGLVALSANRYTNRWVFLATDSDVHVVYGQAQHVLLTDAQEEEVPASLPPELQVDSFLIGRIIVRQGTATFIQVDSAFMQSFSMASVTDVSELSGLGTGVATFLGTPSSANLAAALTDEAGTSGGFVRATGAAIDPSSIGATTPGSAVVTSLLSNSGAIGYTTGAGGSVTQLTDKGTAVTLNKACGSITMHNAALASGATAYFQLTNSLIGANDLVIVNQASGMSFGPDYSTRVISKSAGGVFIALKNESAGSLSEAVVLHFAVIKGVTS